MTTQEYYRLLGFWNAKINAPRGPQARSRRNVKTKANGLGLVCKHSFIKPQVSIEKVYPKYK